jgi:hypothetical protein
VKTSERHQSGETYEIYETKVVDTSIIESFDWNDLKTLIKDEDSWEWRLEDVRATDYIFDEFDK